jgi:hypothetical protein
VVNVRILEAPPAPPHSPYSYLGFPVCGECEQAGVDLVCRTVTPYGVLLNPQQERQGHQQLTAENKTRNYFHTAMTAAEEDTRYVISDPINPLIPLK